MPEEGIGLHDQRVRVVCHLPLNTVEEENAIQVILGYLKGQRKTGGITGFTHSGFRPPGYRGYWWHSRKRRWVLDEIVLFIIDFRYSFSDFRISDIVADLKGTIKAAYRDCGSPQEDVWVIAQQVIRQD